MAIDNDTSYELTGYQVKDLAQKVRAKADSSSLASVATSGLYSDLTGAPTIPTVNNGTLTITQNGTTVGTFTANQSANTTVNLAGGIYADDPTASANPDGWITPNDIDWSTFTYSTSEQRVGTWTNGKPVYKKTVDTGALPNNTSKRVSHGISNLDIVVSLSGSAKGGTTQITLPFTDTTASSSVGVYVAGDYIRIFTDSNRSDFTTSHVTLYYTKTTD